MGVMMTEKRRGRPKKHEYTISFSQAVDKMIAEDNKVDWEELAKKQENQMQVLRLENEDLAKICVERWETIQDKDKIIRYLEGRIEDLTIRSR
jgi:hypothetical protein